MVSDNVANNCVQARSAFLGVKLNLKKAKLLCLIGNLGLHFHKFALAFKSYDLKH